MVTFPILQKNVCIPLVNQCIYKLEYKQSINEMTCLFNFSDVWNNGWNPLKTGDELSCSNIVKLKVSHVCYNSLRKLKISYLAFAGFQNTFIYL
jgi:hypothetical protein